MREPVSKQIQANAEPGSDGGAVDLLVLRVVDKGTIQVCAEIGRH